MKTLLIIILYLIFSGLTLSFSTAQNLNLIVKGKDSLETKVIDSINYIKKFTNYLSLKNEIDSIELKIQKLGYIDSELHSTKKENDSTYIVKFRLYKKYDTIYIYYDEKLLSQELLEPISKHITSKYFITSITKTESLLRYINSKLAENGLPFTSIQLKNLQKKNATSLQANLLITTNKKRQIDKIIIKGYGNFPKSFIKHYLKIANGDVFNLNTIKEKTEILNTLGFARQKKPPEVLFTKDSTSLYLYLEKTKSNNFDGFLGFSTTETTNKLELNGYVNLNLINTLNYGETFNLVYKSDENEQKTFEVNLNMPYLFGSPIGTVFALNIFKKDSTFTTVNQAFDLFYQINSRQKLSVGITGVQSNNLLNTDFSQTIQDYNSNFYTLSYDYRKRQHGDLLFPLNFVFELKLGFGNRIFENISQKQILFNLNTFKIFNLNAKNSFYIKLKTESIDSDTLFTNELVRFGGIKSIRGFEENNLIASLYSVLNTEYRYKLNSTIYVHTIVDAAYFENKITQTTEKLFAFGLGFGINTKAGLLKFNYANGKSENQRFKFSNSKIHLSLNAIF